jgi:uncharacterized integral membrane protein
LKTFLRLLQWTLKAAIFFILLAFALNNQEDVSVHFIWGLQWRAPMVLVLLIVFALGVVVGVLGMVPRWWRQRRLARKAMQTPATEPPKKTVETVAADMYGP